ncbi:MAG: flavin reductase family protein [Pseudomonadota bacterium]
MTIDQTILRKTLSQFVTGVTIVTTRCRNGEPAGITANSFNSVSLDPPLILWSIGRDSRSLSTFENADYFAVHVLSEKQIDLSSRFASVGGDKFEGLDTTSGLGHAPLLTDCAACLECSVFKRVPAGDHIIYIGKVERLDFDHERSPLAYYQGRYARLENAGSIA